MKRVLVLLLVAGCARIPVKLETLEAQFTRTPNIVEINGTVTEHIALNRPSAFHLEISIPKDEAYGAALGKAIYCVVEATGEKCDGQVDEVVPAGDTVRAKIALSCRQALQAGMIGYAQLLLGERSAMFVPKEAIHERDRHTYVYIVEAGQTRVQSVQTGKTYLGAIEIVSGVKAGERIVVSR